MKETTESLALLVLPVFSPFSNEERLRPLVSRGRFYEVWLWKNKKKTIKRGGQVRVQA
jgi:hypothetical protein